VIKRNTAPAQQAIVLAQQEARDLNHNYLGTEHLLLGLLAEGHGAAARALTSLGVSLEVVRDGIAARIGRGQQPPAGHIPFTPRSRKVIELTMGEADRLGHDYFGTGHILLGIAREGLGGAVQVLVAHGVDMRLVREQVIQEMRDDPAGEGGYLRGDAHGHGPGAGGLGHGPGHGPVHGPGHGPGAGGLGGDDELSEVAIPPQLNWHKILPLLDAIEARLTAIEEHLGITPTAPEAG